MYILKQHGVMNESWMFKSFLSVLLFSAPAFSYAQSEMDTRSILPENTQKSILMPNLAINFQLNSTLGEKETEYYARIVEKILADLPKKIVLEGDERHLLSGSKKYDTLKVIAYFPANGEERSDDPFNKITKIYNIQFELPKESKLKRIASEDEGELPSIVERQENFEDFLTKMNKAIMDTSQTDIAEGTPEVILKSPQQLVSSISNNQVKVEPIAEKKIEKQNTSVNIIRQIHLNYFDADNSFKPSQAEDFKRFIKSIKDEKPQKIRVVTQTAANPFMPWKQIQENRVNALMRALKSEGVDTAGLEFSFIYMKSTFKQSVDLSF